MTIRIEHGDMREVLPRLKDEGVQVDACFTDPPYHLTSIVKRFGKKGAAAPKANAPQMARLARGFMGQEWDGGDIAFRPETWRLCFDLMKPGAYIVAFGSSRGYGRLQVAMEDAGFITHPMVGRLSSVFDRLCALSNTLTDDQADELWRIIDAMLPGGLNGWVFGSGFPKATRLKAPNTDHLRYGLQALKPALEPIYMGQKPMEGTGTANWLKYGTGALNIDACRVAGAKPDTTRGASARGTAMAGGVLHAQGRIVDDGAGRWPANLVHDGSDEVMEAFAQFGERKAGGNLNGREPSTPGKNVYGDMGRHSWQSHGDSGSAARFFFSAKAGTEDRWGSKHPTVKPVELVRYFVRLITPPGGLVIDPFAGSGPVAVAAMAEGMDAILVERDAEYAADIRERVEFYRGTGRHSLASRNRRSCKAKAAGTGTPLFAEPHPENV